MKYMKLKMGEIYDKHFDKGIFLIPIVKHQEKKNKRIISIEAIVLSPYKFRMDLNYLSKLIICKNTLRSENQ